MFGWISRLFAASKEDLRPGFPSDIRVSKVEPEDDEILEVWQRDLDAHLLAFHSVDAVRWKDWNTPWQITFGIGEFIREEPFQTTLDEAIYNALMAVSGVKEAYREDWEVYVVSGEPSGRELVEEVSKAIDGFVAKHIDEWEKDQKA